MQNEKSVPQHLLIKAFLYVLGGLLEALYFLFPTPTALFLETTLGVTDITIVSWIMTAIAILGLALLLLLVVPVIWRRSGLQIIRKKSMGTVPKGEVVQVPLDREHGEPLLTPKQHKYREEVRADLLRIRIQLHDFIVPKLILFKSWNASTEPDFHSLKHQLIGVKEQDDAIERFSTALNNRNDGRLTPMFHDLNEECVARFREISKTGFLDTVSSEPPPKRPLPSFVVSTAQEPENLKMREIRIQLASGEILTREANFYTVSIGVPVGSENAEEFKLQLRHTDTIYKDELWNISTTGVPYILVPWNVKQKPRPETCDDFATAVLEARIRHFTLTAGANSLNQAVLVLFYTLRDCEDIYFPTFNQKKTDMHTKFQVELYAEAAKRPNTLLKRFEISGRNWDSVSVRELPLEV
jgi:hypothetical protein